MELLLLNKLDQMPNKDASIQPDGLPNCSGPIVDSVCVITCLEHKDD